MDILCGNTLVYFYNQQDYSKSGDYRVINYSPEYKLYKIRSVYSLQGYELARREELRVK